MSLINQVLREVDQRQGAGSSNASIQPGAAAPAPRRRGRPLWPALAALLVLSVPLAWWWLGQPGEPSRPAAELAAPQPPALAQPLPAPRPEPAAETRQATSTTPLDPAPAEISPPEPAPAAGTLPAQAAADIGNQAAPPESARAPNPDTSPAEPSPAAVAEPAATTAPAETAQATLTEPPAITPMPALTTPAAPPQRPAAGAAAEVDSADPPAAQISIQRADRPTRAADPLEEAQRALSRGQTGLAEERLRELLGAQAEHIEARRLLATLLAASGRRPAAVALLEEGLALQSSAALAGLLGRLLAEGGELQPALTVLATHAPALDDNIDYHLLHAALLRQAGRHTEARDQYQTLTRLAPANAAAWVGLGASHEALGQADAARMAYQQALRLDQAELAAFARARLRALN